jgi:hypothetical protein
MRFEDRLDVVGIDTGTSRSICSSAAHRIVWIRW